MLVLLVIVLLLLAPSDLYKNGIMVMHCAMHLSVAHMFFVLQTQNTLFTQLSDSEYQMGK